MKNKKTSREQAEEMTRRIIELLCSEKDSAPRRLKSIVRTQSRFVKRMKEMLRGIKRVLLDE